MTVDSSSVSKTESVVHSDCDRYDSNTVTKYGMDYVASSESSSCTLLAAPSQLYPIMSHTQLTECGTSIYCDALCTDYERSQSEEEDSDMFAETPNQEFEYVNAVEASGISFEITPVH